MTILGDKFHVCISTYTGPGKRMVPRLQKLFRQGQAEVVSNSKNKILATWEPFFRRALYTLHICENLRTQKMQKKK